MAKVANFIKIFRGVIRLEVFLIYTCQLQYRIKCSFWQAFIMHGNNNSFLKLNVNPQLMTASCAVQNKTVSP
jgi:hypothetical protein